MKRTARFTLAIAVVGSIGIAVPEGWAVTDSKVYPGSTCIARNGASQGDLYYNPAPDYDGAMLNNSGSNKYVVCPIVHDSTASSLSDVDVSMELDAGEDLDCCVQSCTATGSTCDVECDGWTGGGRQTQDMVVPGAWADGFYFLQCLVEAGAEILSFRVEENV